MSGVEAERQGGGGREREREGGGWGGGRGGGVRQREAEIVGNLPPVSRGTKRNTRFLFIYFDRCGSLAQLAYATILRDLRGVLEHLRAPMRSSRLPAPTDEGSVGPKHSGRQGKEGRAIGGEAGLTIRTRTLSE
jgi:hypothetical protein